MGVLVALLAVLVVLEDVLGDEVTADGARERGIEVLDAVGAPDLVPLARILELQGESDRGERAGDARPAQADGPADLLASEAMQDEEPGAGQGQQDVDQYATLRAVGSLTTITPSTRVRTMPETSSPIAAENSA